MPDMALVSSAGDLGIPALNECRGLSLDPRPGHGTRDDAPEWNGSTKNASPYRCEGAERRSCERLTTEWVEPKAKLTGSRSAAGAYGLEAFLGGTGELGLHFAEFLALGLGPPDSPGDEQNADDADDAVEPPLVVIGDDPGDRQQRHHVHDLDQRVERQAGRVLERIADSVAGDSRLVPLGALAGRLGARLVLDQLLGIVPGAAGVGHEHGEQLSDYDHARQVAAQCLSA